MKSWTTLALATATLLATTSAQAEIIVIPPQYTLTYNAADGSLVIDTFDGSLFTYSIKSTGDLGGDDGFIELNHILLSDSVGIEGPPANTSLDDELSQSDFDGWSNLGQFDLGEVLPAGLNQLQFNATLDSSIQNTFYVDQLGTNGQPESFNSFDIVYNVPEPGSIIIFGIGTAMLAQRRRRNTAE